MMRCTRPAPPQILVTSAVAFTKAWIAKLNAKPKGKWTWPQKGTVKSRDQIVSALQGMTDNHCSFCDSAPLGQASRKEIEHLRPKSIFPEHAFDWLNLYLACSVCNGKKQDKYDTQLLQPDAANYSFASYFILSAKGELIPNLAADQNNINAAEITIAIFDLNRVELKLERLRQIQGHPGNFRFI
jgi:uncharacterized protein (TIGR02646 family)